MNKLLNFVFVEGGVLLCSGLSPNDIFICYILCERLIISIFLSIFWLW